jgi:hypothetical protein
MPDATASVAARSISGTTKRCVVPSLRRIFGRVLDAVDAVARLPDGAGRC